MNHESLPSVDDCVRFDEASVLNFIVGRMRAGLAQVDIVTSMLFGGVSGSAVADCALADPVEKAPINPTAATVVSFAVNIRCP